MIVGLGVDVVELERFVRHLASTPGLRERLFTEAERELAPASLAARFAAKEATIKALGGPVGTWHDVWVERAESGAPLLQFSGAVLQRVADLGASRRHLSLSHDGAVAIATVILESE